nr:MAG TPA: hypothetical protein [Caudoviricetes sp.]
MFRLRIPNIRRNSKHLAYFIYLSHNSILYTNL